MTSLQVWLARHQRSLKVASRCLGVVPLGHRLGSPRPLDDGAAPRGPSDQPLGAPLGRSERHGGGVSRRRRGSLRQDLPVSLPLPLTLMRVSSCECREEGVTETVLIG